MSERTKAIDADERSAGNRYLEAHRPGWSYLPGLSKLWEEAFAIGYAACAIYRGKGAAAERPEESRANEPKQVPEPSTERIGCNICGEALPDGEPHLCSEPQGKPSDAPTRRVAHTGPGHASGDAGYCEGCLADYEQGATGRIPGEPLTLGDLAREHERLAEHPNQMSQTIPAFHTLTAKALRWAALRAAGGVR